VCYTGDILSFDDLILQRVFILNTEWYHYKWKTKFYLSCIC